MQDKHTWGVSAGHKRFKSEGGARMRRDGKRAASAQSLCGAPSPEASSHDIQGAFASARLPCSAPALSCADGQPPQSAPLAFSHSILGWHSSLKLDCMSTNARSDVSCMRSDSAQVRAGDPAMASGSGHSADAGGQSPSARSAASGDAAAASEAPSLGTSQDGGEWPTVTGALCVPGRPILLVSLCFRCIAVMVTEFTAWAAEAHRSEACQVAAC
jgi:hypothetical protein